MGYVFQHQDGLVYQRQQETPGAQAILASHLGLLRHLLQPQRGRRLLEVGCGAGHVLQRLDGNGFQLTGLDASLPMLEMAREQLSSRVELHHGNAESLPFEDNEFDYVSLLHTLEFVDSPVRALSEACRVAKEALYVGLVNKHAIQAAAYRLQGICMPTIFNRARFFSIWEIRRWVNSILDRAPFEWRTLHPWPPRGGRDFKPQVPTGWRERLPFGIVAGIKIVPIPCFRTTPLSLKLKIKPAAKRWVESGTCNGCQSEPPASQQTESDR